MKTLKYIWSSAFVALLLTIASCGGGGDDPTPATDTEAQKVTSQLTSGTWKINSVTVDGINKNDLFTNMTIVFTSSGFTTTNGGVVWPAIGTWSFVDPTAKAITRSDAVTVSLDAITDTSLTLSLTWTKTTLGGGRINSIAGKHVFVLKK